MNDINQQLEKLNTLTNQLEKKIKDNTKLVEDYNEKIAKIQQIKRDKMSGSQKSEKQTYDELANLNKQSNYFKKTKDKIADDINALENQLDYIKYEIDKLKSQKVLDVKPSVRNVEQNVEQNIERDSDTELDSTLGSEDIGDYLKQLEELEKQLKELEELEKIEKESLKDELEKSESLSTISSDSRPSISIPPTYLDSLGSRQSSSTISSNSDKLSAVSIPPSYLDSLGSRPSLSLSRESSLSSINTNTNNQITGFSETLIKAKKEQPDIVKANPNIICPILFKSGKNITMKKYYIPSQFPNLTKIKEIIPSKGGRRTRKHKI